VKRIFVPNKEEVTGGWRKLDNEEPQTLFSSTYSITVTKSRIRGVEHIAEHMRVYPKVS
jgi:hypothetical protein